MGVATPPSLNCCLQYTAHPAVSPPPPYNYCPPTPRFRALIKEHVGAQKGCTQKKGGAQNGGAQKGDYQFFVPKLLPSAALYAYTFLHLLQVQ